MTKANIIGRRFGGEWREHPRHAGYYFSRDGRAASFLARTPRLLSGTTCGRGYRAISCALGDVKYQRVYIHRAVCEIFNGGLGEGLHCRHLDNNKNNCAADNLSWGTAAENSADSVAAGMTASGERNGQAKLTRIDVSQMREARRATGRSYEAIAHDFGVTYTTARKAILGEYWK